MKTARLRTLTACALAATLAVGTLLPTVRAQGQGQSFFDFGEMVERLLQAFTPVLFGVGQPLAESALGPFTGGDENGASVAVAQGLRVSVVSSAVNPQADMIALWPNDQNPTALYVCIEGGTGGPGVQRIDLSAPPDANATTILQGVTSCDPIRRTPWGSIVAAEEAGANGGLYEIMDPASITAPIMVTNRATGATSDPRVVKRKAVGSLSWEGNVILEDGTMYMGDELRPSLGKAGGGIYKFVPAVPFAGAGVITDPSLSPFAAGSLFGMRLGTNPSGSTPNADYGQGSEIGKGVWVAIDPTLVTDTNGNIILGTAQTSLRLTGYYRPEDMDQDPAAAARGEVRVCWTNTGRMTNGGGSVVEGAANFGEVNCLTDAADEAAVAGGVPQVTRFLVGDTQANHFDNLDFQPRSNRLIVLEDGGVDVVRPDGTTETRGNDIWMCLPDGRDRDTLTDGCVRILSLRDTDSEPTGFIFTASGRSAYVNLQHRNTGRGALLRIDGFRVP